MGFEADKPLALQFVGIDDARQTDVCHSLSGVVRPYGDPFWQSHFPPLHFNCRSTIRAIYDEAELPEEWSALDEAESPAKGFGSYPLDSDNWWKELDSQVRQAKQFGVQGEIEAAKKILFETKGLSELTTPKPAELENVTTYTPLATKEECEKFLLDNFGIKADYSHIHISVANRYNETIVDVRKTFGKDSLRRLKNIEKMPKNEEDNVAGAYSPSKNTLYLRKATKNGLEKLGQEAWNQKHNGYWSTSNPLHVIRHELGHAVADSVASVVSKKYKELHELWEATLAKCKPWEYANVLSRYGMENCDDFIAECIAEYMNGNPRELARKVVSILLKGDL